MKLWERNIELHLRGVTNAINFFFWFYAKEIFLIRQLMKRCREQEKDLHMVFIDLEKAYDKVTRNAMTRV
jgi:hypothetical protein